MTATIETTALPKIVSRAEWLAARNRLLVKEKEHTRRGDALSAERRKSPMVRIEKDYVFAGPDGKATLLDLFEGRKQLLLYHFMFAPEWDEGCVGCSFMVDNMCHPAHLHARNTSLVAVSRAPLEKILRFKARMGWNIPWYSSFGTDFNKDFGATTDEGEIHIMSAFIRNGDEIFQTYSTEDRGTEHLGSAFTLLDLTAYGRQEEWEDSPAGWPKTPPYQWWRHHDKY